MKKHIFTILSLILLGCFSAKADVTVSINDTTVTTDHIIIPVNGTTGDFTGKTVEYTFRLRYAQCNVLDIASSAGYAMNGSYAYNYDSKSRLLTITTSNIQSNFNGTLFAIKFQLVPRMDFYYNYENIMAIAPLTVKVFGQNIDTTYQLANKEYRVRIDTMHSDSVRQTFSEGLSQNYPNPFNFETVVMFSVVNPSKIKAHLYSFSGNIVQSIPEDTNGPLLFDICDSKNTIIADAINYKFPKGIYKIVFRVNKEKIAVGNYRLLFETDNSKHSINLSFIN